MPKGKTTVFFCQECGYESSKWMGQCPACKEWNTFVEEMIDKKSAAKRRQGSGKSGRGEERSALTDRDDTGQTHVDGYERA